MDSCRRRQRFLCRDTNFWYRLCEVAVTDKPQTCIYLKLKADRLTDYPACMQTGYDGTSSGFVLFHSDDLKSRQASNFEPFLLKNMEACVVLTCEADMTVCL